MSGKTLIIYNKSGDPAVTQSIANTAIRRIKAEAGEAGIKNERSDSTMIDIVAIRDITPCDETVKARRRWLVGALDTYIADSAERERAISALSLIENAFYNQGKADGQARAYVAITESAMKFLHKSGGEINE